MRYRLLVLPLLAMAASACAPSAGWDSGPRNSGNSREKWPDAPLVARLYPSGGDRVIVSVNRPAHIAVFEIAPGRGVSLVYPLSQFDENRLVQGSEWLNPSYLGRSRWFYDAGVPFYQAYAGPSRFYLLVASRLPLETSRFRYSPGALRTALGVDYASYHETQVLDQLVQHVLPLQPEDDWSTDILAIWPEGGLPAVPERLVRVICPDGSVQVVPRSLVGYTCRFRDSAPPQVRPDSMPDDGKITRPGGRRPRPQNPGTPAEGELGIETSSPARRPQEGRRILPPAEEGGAARPGEPRSGDGEGAAHPGESTPQRRPGGLDRRGGERPSQPNVSRARQTSRSTGTSGRARQPTPSAPAGRSQPSSGRAAPASRPPPASRPTSSSGGTSSATPDRS